MNDTACIDQECAERHCTVCPSRKRHHVAFGTVVCPSCVGKARGHLKAIEHLACDLPGEAIERGVNSQAANLNGPVADPEAFMHMRASIARGRVSGPMPEEDQHHPLAVLGRWILFIGEDYGDYWPADKPLTVSGAVDWLDKRLTRIAHDLGANGQPVHDFDGFLLELSTCRRHVEDVLHDGEREERGVPCPECPEGEKPRLVLKHNEHDRTGAHDRWCCPREQAHWWSEGDYRLRVGTIYREHATKLTAGDMLIQYRIPPGTLRRWANEKPPLVRKRGFDGSKRQLYDVADATAARDANVANAC